MKTDMSPASISSRIREVARLSGLRVARDGASAIDYSPAAISGRIREVEALRRLCEALSEARPVET